jgi:hypothetical protein
MTHCVSRNPRWEQTAHQLKRARYRLDLAVFCCVMFPAGPVFIVARAGPVVSELDDLQEPPGRRSGCQ